MSNISHLTAPVFVWWDVTYLCNLHCKQCYSSSGKKYPNELSTKEAKRLIDQLSAMKVFYIYFLGGEPLLRDDIFELVIYARERGVASMMSTNGWFITSQIARRLEKAGFMHVRVSIDGAKAKTHDSIRGKQGSFSRAIRAVKILRQTNISRIGISPTVLGENIDEIPGLIEIAVRLGVDEMQLVQLCARGRGSEVQAASAEQLYKLRDIFKIYKERLVGRLNLTATEGISFSEGFSDLNNIDSLLPNFWGCPASRTCLAIEAEGTIQPCILFRSSAGNIRTESLKNIWHKSQLFQKMRQPSVSCRGCDYEKACSGECPIDNCPDDLFRREFAVCSRRRKGGKYADRAAREKNGSSET